MSDNLKLMGLVGTLMAVLFTWVWSDLKMLHDKKADKAVVAARTQSRWTGEQQEEYRKLVQSQIDALQRRVDNVEPPKDCSP